MARYIWAAVAGGLFVTGIIVGYLIFANTFNIMTAQNPQLTVDRLRQDPVAMWQVMSDPDLQRRMVADPELRQQMMEQMRQDPEFMRRWVNDTQFQQDWMYPHMMQNWRMGPGMGPGMMGGPMMRYGADAVSSPAIQADRVEIPQGAWSPRSAEPYRPLHIEVEQGAEVTWTNRDGDAVHTVTDVDNRFDSKLISPGQSWSHAFDSAGRYDYYCAIHPWMRGTVTVVAAASG